MARSYFILRVSVLMFMTAVCCGLFFNEKPAADLNPVDVLVFIGETLQVNCTLTLAAKDISVSDMYIAIYNTSTEWRVPIENTTILDNKTILARFEITDDYEQYNKIMCKNKNTNLITKGLYVERPIQNVTNFSGVYIFDDHKIVTNWSLGETYLNTIQVDIDWNPNSAPNESGNSCNDSTNTLCVINYTGSDVLIIRIKVRVNSNFKRPSEEFLVPLYDTQATSLHAFRPLDSLKTGPPQSMAVVDKSSMCVNISWHNPVYFITAHDDPILRFELKMDSETEYKVVKDNVIPKSSTFAELCQLIPYTRYFLSVRIKARDQNPWSDPAVVEFITEEDRPLTGPPLKDTSYYTEDCQENVRKLNLYWNDPSKASLQGQLTRYEVVVNNNQPELLRFSANFYTASLDCESTYEISVYSVTKVGRSFNQSTIIIPKESAELAVKDDLMFRVEDISESSGGRSTVNISVKWVPEGLAADTTLTLYMCQETYSPKTCLNNFQTVEVKVSQRNVSLYNIPVTTNLFGYSLRNEMGQKRGIKWTNCVYRADIRPTKQTNLHVNTGSLPNSLIITWTPTPCSKGTKLLILKYHIYICHKQVDYQTLVAGTTACSSVVISDMSVSTYTATDLQAGIYYVYLLAESPAGLGLSAESVRGIAKPSNLCHTFYGASIRKHEADCLEQISSLISRIEQCEKIRKLF